MSSRDDEPNSKLSFFSLPAKSPPPAGMLTPPLRSSASVPFRWEEAPGRPRPSDEPRSARRSLELPPRLLVQCSHRHHSRITNMPSPTTVLEGPDACRSLSYGRSFHKERAGYFGSRRWGSFRNTFGNKEMVGVEATNNKVKFRRRASLLSVSSTVSSHLWGGIYQSLKQVVPWKRERNKTRKVV